MLDVMWPGYPGNTYRFELYPTGTEFKPLAGVYVLCKKGLNNSFHALYVGETQSFYNRLNASSGTHDGYKRAAALGMTHISVYQCSTSIVRTAIETELRHSLNPPCNVQSNPTLG